MMKVFWVYETKGCPCCGSLNVETGEENIRDGIMIFRCREPSCRWRFSVKGKLSKILSPVKKQEEKWNETVLGSLN